MYKKAWCTCRVVAELSLNLLLFWCSPCRRRRSFVGSLLESWSNDVFERRTSAVREAFFLLVCLDASKFALLTVFMLIETIYPKNWAKRQPTIMQKIHFRLTCVAQKTSDAALIAVTSFKSSLKKYWLILAKMGILVLLEKNISASSERWPLFAWIDLIRYLKKIIHPFGNIADCAREYGRTSI